MDKPTEPKFDWQDLTEVAIGACIVAFHIAATEETWNLTAELSFGRVLVFAVISFCVLALVIYVFHKHQGYSLTHKAFVRRVIVTYGMTIFISALLLFAIDRLDFFQDPLTAVKRTIFVAFPAVFAATTVDRLSDRS